MNTPAKIPALQILFPGPERWELWSLDASTGESSCQTMAEPSFEGPASRRILALPVACTYAIPIWVFAQNDEELRGAAQLHLEKDGLSRPEEPTGFDFERIQEQGTRVLIRIDALAKADIKLSSTSHPPDVVCLSPRLLPLPDGQLVVWRELGKFVAAITRNGKLIYHNVTSAPKFDGKLADEVIRWAKQFQFQGMIEPLEGLTFWADGADEGVEAKTGLPVLQEARPAPRFVVGSGSGIVPHFVQEIRRREAHRARVRQGLRAGGILAGLVLIGFLAALVWSHRKQARLLDRIATLSPAASEIEQIQARWDEVSAAVDPDRSPLELMLLIHSLPSANQVSLTRFERSRDRLGLKGRATSPSEALKFLGAISKSEELSNYQWTYTQPLIAQDGTATFEIEGILSTQIP